MDIVSISPSVTMINLVSEEIKSMPKSDLCPS